MENLVKLENRVLKVSLNKKTVKIRAWAYIINNSNKKIGEQKFYIDKDLYKTCNLKQYKKRPLLFKPIYTFKFNIEDILKDSSTINGIVRFTTNIDGEEIEYRAKKRNILIRIFNRRKYYKPIKAIYVDDWALHIRRTNGGNLVFVKRKKEPIENTDKFKFLESKPISFILYHLGKFRFKKTNIFYEKFSEKAEEGVFELCQMCNKKKTSKNYFIIDEQSEDYQKLKQYKNVVKKYSFKYYWLIYSCKSFIASEAPAHLNVLRSNNKYLRLAFVEKKFIFLQHGIIYMKNLGVNSSFCKGREAESTYMVVSSEKEKNIVKQMLGYSEKNFLKTGLAMYDKIKYNHINQDSENYVTIMLTWKPYEEQLYNFEESSYYKNIIEIEKMLEKYIKKEHIIIIAHPKAKKLLENTNIRGILWEESISCALEKTKLLITDYSSVCYNAFYQGAGVMFFQPDLELYEKENGNLIPSEEEYIGKRAFNITDLETIIKQTIINNEIILDEIRTKKFKDIYTTINEFHDGKNAERIYNELERLKII